MFCCEEPIFFSVCPAVRAWWCHVIPWLARLLDVAYDCIPVGRDALESDFLVGPRRKRRLDEDVVAALIYKTQQPGQAGCASNWALATGELDPGMSAHLHHKELVEQNAAAWFAHAGTRLCFCVHDASRFGNPKRDVLMVFALDCESDILVPCPGQVAYY